jgi:hypothetical protein
MDIGPEGKAFVAEPAEDPFAEQPQSEPALEDLQIDVLLIK